MAVGPCFRWLLMLKKPLIKRGLERRIVDTSLSDRVFDGGQIKVRNSEFDRDKSTNVDRVDVVVGL